MVVEERLAAAPGVAAVPIGLAAAAGNTAMPVGWAAAVGKAARRWAAADASVVDDSLAAVAGYVPTTAGQVTPVVVALPLQFLLQHLRHQRPPEVGPSSSRGPLLAQSQGGLRTGPENAGARNGCKCLAGLLCVQRPAHGPRATTSHVILTRRPSKHPHASQQLTASDRCVPPAATCVNKHVRSASLPLAGQLEIAVLPATPATPAISQSVT